MLSEQELLDDFDTISNWSRWGSHDDIGTLNLITPEVIRAASGEVKIGISIGCGVLDMPGPPPNRSPYDHHMISTGRDDAPGYGAGTDYIGLAFHGSLHTHLDALSHVFFDGKMYNGRPASLVTQTGATVGAVTAMSQGIVTRGVIADVPALRGVEYVVPEEPVEPEELDSALDRQGVTIQPGNALVIYVGRAHRRRREGQNREHINGGRHLAGPSARCLRWLHERDVSLLISDGGNEAQPGPIGRATFPIHIGTIVYLGMPLIDNAQLEPLVSACREHHRSSFLLAVGPLAIAGGTGSPVNPIAVL